MYNISIFIFCSHIYAKLNTSLQLMLSHAPPPKKCYTQVHCTWILYVYAKICEHLINVILFFSIIALYIFYCTSFICRCIEYGLEIISALKIWWNIRIFLMLEQIIIQHETFIWSKIYIILIYFYLTFSLPAPLHLAWVPVYHF